MHEGKGEFLNAEAVAALFDRTVSSLYTERYRGEGLGTLGVKVGRRLYWRRSDIDRWFTEQQQPAAAS
jgi:hypothetical protein